MAEIMTSSPGLRWLTHPDEAIAWFRDKLQQFYLLPSKIAALRQRAQAVHQTLVVRDPAIASQAASVATKMNLMQTDQASLQSQVTGLLNQLGSHGIKLPGLEGYNDVRPQLGAIPLVVVGILAGTGAVIALGISSLFTNYAKQKSLLDQIEKGNLTPQEAAEIARKTGGGGILGTLGVDLSPILWIAGIGAALYFLGPQLRRRFA
jgi:hypothetical protein